MKIQKRVLAAVLALVMALGSLSALVACNHEDTCKHEWQDATCTTPKTCKLCSYTEGGLAAHTGGAATCSQKAVCSVCKAEYGETAAHTYENGKCKTCGKDENAGSNDNETGSGADGACDHTKLHEESFDFGEHGACDYVIYYQTCDCGEVKLLDADRSVLLCSINEDDMDYEESEDENGNETATMKGRCELCGMEISALAVSTEKDCARTISYTYTFVMNGKTLLENVVQEDEYEYHNEDYERIDLSEYGCCGGWAGVYKCTDCSEVVGFDVDSINPQCNIDLEEEPESEEITDENGIVHTVRKAECAECGFKLVVDRYEKELSACETEYGYLYGIYCKDTVIAEYEEKYTEDAHEYEYTYEMKGESCEDGYITTAYCDVCKESRRYRDWGHDTDSEELALSEHGFCHDIEVWHCRVCDKDVDVSDYRCWWESTGVNPDGSENFECMDCGGVKIEYHGASEKDENCEITVTYRYIYKMNGIEVYKLEGTEKYTDHDYEYTYDMEGETCDDGIKATGVCKDCGKTTEYESEGHETDYREIPLGEHGLCENGYVEERYCVICDTILDVYINDWCSWTLVSETEDSEIYRCTECGAVREHVENVTEPDESCTVFYTYTVTYKLNGKVVYTGTESGEDTEHDYEYSYEMKGETCEDGYTVTYECKNCGGGDSYSDWGHDSEYTTVDLGELGFCGGEIQEYYCTICKTVVDTYVFDYYCGWSIKSETDTQAVYECEDCGAIKTVTYEYGEKDENCIYDMTKTVVYKLNGKEVCRYTESEYYHDHDYEYTYDMIGETCFDGYTVSYECKNCGDSDSYEDKGHVEDYMTTDLGEHGLCGGSVDIEYCTLCQDVLFIFDGCDCWNWHGGDYEGKLWTCWDCGAKKTENIMDVAEKDEECYLSYIQRVTYYDANGNLICTFDEDRGTYEHDYEFVYDYDGYIVEGYCKDCGREW